MKRCKCTLIPLLAAFALLTGCGSQDKQLTVQPPPASSGNTATPVSPDQNGSKADMEVLQQLQVTVSQAKEARDVTAFLDEHLKQVDAKMADQMFLALESFYASHVSVVNDHFRNLLQQPGVTDKLYALDHPYDFSKIQNDDKLKQWLQTQTAGKLTLMATSDMSLYWQVDYPALQAASSGTPSRTSPSFGTVCLSESITSFKQRSKPAKSSAVVWQSFYRGLSRDFFQIGSKCSREKLLHDPAGGAWRKCSPDDRFRG